MTIEQNSTMCQTMFQFLDEDTKYQVSSNDLKGKKVGLRNNNSHFVCILSPIDGVFFITWGAICGSRTTSTMWAVSVPEFGSRRFCFGNELVFCLLCTMVLTQKMLFSFLGLSFWLQVSVSLLACNYVLKLSLSKRHEKFAVFDETSIVVFISYNGDNFPQWLKAWKIN